MFRIHMRQERSALIGWSIGVFLYFLLIGLSYATVKDNADYDKLWEEMPEGMREAFGGSESITSVDGFVESQATSYLPLVLGIFVIAAATKRTAGAEESGTLDHLLARPISRTRFLASLAGVLGLNVGLIIAAAALGTVLGMAASGVGLVGLVRLVAMFVDILPITLALLSLGILVGVLAHRRAPAFGIGLAFVVTLYAVNVLAQIVDALSWLAWTTPFGLWARSDAFHGELEPVYYAASLVIMGASLAVSFWWFDRKDLYA